MNKIIKVLLLANIAFLIVGCASTKNSDSVFLQTEKLLQEEKYEEAVIEIKNNLATSRADKDKNYYYLSVAYNKMSLHELALTSAEKSLKNKYDVKTLAEKAYALAMTEKTDEAIEAYNNVLEEDKGNFEAYFQRGICFERKKQYTEALKDFLICIQGKPKESRYFFSAANAYSENKDYKEAVKILLRLKHNIEKDTDIDSYDMVDLYYELGNLYLKDKEFDKAMESFSSALEISDYDAYIYYEMARCQVLQNKYEEAIKYLNYIYEEDDEYLYDISEDSDFYEFTNSKIYKDFMKRNGLEF